MDPAEHHQWLTQRLGQDSPRLWIGEVDGTPVGQVRLDLDGSDAEVSIAVAPDARGKGLGRAMLEALKPVATEDPGIDRLVALVHPDNAAAVRLFKTCGFERAGRQGSMNQLIWPAVSSEDSSQDP